MRFAVQQGGEKLPGQEDLGGGEGRRRPQPPAPRRRRRQQHHRRSDGPGVFRLHRHTGDQPRQHGLTIRIAVAGAEKQAHRGQRQGQGRHVEHQIDTGQQRRPQHGHHRQRQFDAGGEAAKQAVQRPHQQQHVGQQAQLPQPRPFAEQPPAQRPGVRQHRRPEDLVGRLRLEVPEHLEAVGVEGMLVVLEGIAWPGRRRRCAAV